MKNIISEKRLHKIVGESIKKVLEEEWQKEKKSYILSEHKALKSNQNVMERYYGITHNEYQPVLLKETTLDRILKKHGENGYVCISANRSDYPSEVNDKNTKQLISDIKQSGFSYLPTYGGYRSKDTGVMDDFEPSFLVFNYDTNGNSLDFDTLRTFALKMCGKYEQDSVLIKYPNSAPTWENSIGEVVSEKSTDTYWKNDPTKEYFTSLQSKNDIEKKENAYVDKRTKQTKYPISKRFTYDINEVYVNPLPINLIEEQRRKGEIMIWRI